MFALGKKSCSHMVGVNPDLIRVAHRAIEITRIDFGIPSTGGWRSDVDQNTLFKKGVSECDGFVEISYHQTGNALDFYALDPKTGKASWDKLLLAQIAAAFLQAAAELGVKLEWGGLFKNFLDMPHVQIPED